ncbi:FAD binding domain-containingprotein [Purpureocillium lilacinum]|uniref:FAD binding domain-containingprotein n=1 Tax=Purpureocillium lilacinum TaxID=33203 RepID=A0A179FEV5_PURLI|nr:FAD binding domain-containingprotein [Purpureocillium lilacinum]OAQ63761.1 FAD binding domain-containingprotein [Purpureocillium lilacinum]OAQ75032.1 FAD binding domain-containingprotein [Purpureocillium lilacinum]
MEVVYFPPKTETAAEEPPNAAPTAPESTNPPALKVIIVGGGIGGQTAAIALRQQGHHVKVYEQSRFANETGAAIHLVPNGLSVLHHLGVPAEEHGANEITSTRLRKHSGEIMNVFDHSSRRNRFQKDWLLTHRAHLHDHLKAVATSAEGLGKPADLLCSSKVQRVDPEKGVVYLANGEEDQADVIVGADGVHSVCRNAICDDVPVPHPSKDFTFRFLLSREEVESDPDTAPHVNPEVSLDIWYGLDRKVVIYPCARNKILNFVCIHPAELTKDKLDLDGDALKVAMLSIYEGFQPAGGAMAIEDGGSLGIMLSKGITPDEVPERLELYNKARYDRATLCQELTRLTGGDGIKSTEFDTSKLNLNNTLEYFLPHDEIHASTEVLRRHLWKKDESARWKQPIVFGPMPGPRNIPSECSQGGAPSTVTTATVRFRTSATLLKNLFPNKAYSFSHDGSVGEVSFVVQQLRNLDWLGGGGYNVFSLYLHDIRYTKEDGTKIHGFYCPVTFEDCADPMIAGREDLGWPKLFSDIDIQQPSEGSMEVSLSWHGAKWASFWLRGLQKKNPEAGDSPPGPATPQEDGIFIHKYVPGASGKFDQPDAEYDMFIPKPFGKNMSERHQSNDKLVTSVAEEAGVEFFPLGWSKLPTLNHIVSRIAELPNFGNTVGSLKPEAGMRDFSGGYRVE